MNNYILHSIINTPMVEFKSLKKNKSLFSNIYGKLEMNNITGSIKVRIAYGMIKDAEDKGLVNKDTTIIEATSGNTGIGLAYVCEKKGYKLILTMPENMSEERKILLRSYGVELILTPSILGMDGAMDKAKELNKEIINSFYIDQFNNMSNVYTHRLTTGIEIYNDLKGEVDYLICGVGTGGTISGVGEYLKYKNPKTKVIAIEPDTSNVLSGGKKGEHKIQGIGTGFVPSILNLDVIDEVMCVSYEECVTVMKDMFLYENIKIGISSGAVISAAIKISQRVHDKKIVVILADSYDRYESLDILDKN